MEEELQAPSAAKEARADSWDSPLLMSVRGKSSSSAEDAEDIFLLPQAKQPAQRPVKAPTLGFFAVAVVLFASVAGGPYGIEAALGAAGALPVLVGTIMLAIFWSTPQALVAAELSTSFPSNGGYITWVVKGLGPVLGFVNAANALTSAVCNLPLYPVLLASSVEQAFPNMPSWQSALLKVVVTVITVTLNSLGIEAVSATNTIVSVIVQLPFIVIPIAAAAYKQTFTWSAIVSITPNWSSQFSVFVSTLCWNSLGWVNIGNVASDVKNPQRSYPLGAGLAVILTAINYLYPVALCASLAPDMSKWDTGYFVTVGSNVAAWTGYLSMVGAAFSCFNNFQPQLGTTARALRYAALYKMIPIPLLDRNWDRFRTPLPALLFQGAIVLVLMNFGFDVLVIINVLYYNVAVLLQFIAFLRLRYTQPTLHRPYTAPGGIVGAWILVLLLCVTIFIGFYAAASTAWWSLIIVGCSNIVFVVLGVLWWKYLYREGVIDEMDARDAVYAPAPAVETPQHTGVSKTMPSINDARAHESDGLL